jgi:PIN domain nuclease of toxin-antitoxin system
MNFLFDTHTILWFLDGSSSLSQNAKKSIENTHSTKFISIASLWEITIKQGLGKISTAIPLEELMRSILENGFEILPLDFGHILTLSRLEDFHRDPFDRIIIAQALTENLGLISKDRNFNLYSGVKLVW